MHPFPPETHADLREAAAAYAATVDLDVDLDAVEWEVSTRARRRAGACLCDRETGQVTIRLAWEAARAYDRETFAAVVRHELVHAWEFQRFGEAGHGERFREQAAHLDVPVRCPQFSTPRLGLRCLAPDCAWEAGRHRASVTVREPERHRCGECGGRYVVEHVASGVTWRDERGYREARTRLGDRW